MTNKLPLPLLRERAISLRRAGKSRREIQEILQIRSNGTLNEILRGEPPQPWTRRPNAKDDVRAKARELRERGLAYQQIATELGVSKSSVSLWVRDLPRPERLSYEECAKRRDVAVAGLLGRERPRRAKRQGEAVRADAQDSIGPLTAREILIAGAIAYWCEGAKSKPYRRADRVIFINSDPLADQVLPRFPDGWQSPRASLPSGSASTRARTWPSAQEFWLRVTRADPASSAAPNLKRHNPRTVRMNTGRGLPRLPAGRGAAQPQPVPADRGVVRRGHGERRDDAVPESTWLGRCSVS